MATKKINSNKVKGKRRKAKARASVYLTKQILTRVASKGFREAAAATTAVMGYNVIAQDGWVVKKHADGRIEPLKQIHNTKLNHKIVLD